jgi:hypothetical protein
MRRLSDNVINKFSILMLAILVLPAGRLVAQNKIGFGLFADPVISWFSTDTKETRNNGARAGFNFGLTYNKYFANNYAFATGISILSAGGTLKNTVPIDMKFNNPPSVNVDANQPVVYRIQYVNIPIGLKFKSNQIGYITFFSDIGIDPKVVIGGSVDIPSLSISKEGAMNELNRFNLAYHIVAGIEYSLGGSTAVVLGLGFDNNFLDVTKDNTGQPPDKVTQKILKFRIGINF